MNNNATATSEVSKLQSAIPAAVLQASKKPAAILAVKDPVNIRRAIYDMFKDIGEPALGSEMVTHFGTLGYNTYAVQSAYKQMHLEGMLIRSDLKPYAYRLVEGCPVPSDEKQKFRASHKKRGSMRTAAKSKASTLPGTESLTKAMGSLSKNLHGNTGFHYGSLATDLDMITMHLSKMKKHCVEVSQMANVSQGIDKDVAREYGPIESDIDTILTHIGKMRKTFQQIHEMARSIRINPL